MNRCSPVPRCWLVVECLSALPAAATAQVEGMVGVEGRTFAVAADSFNRAEPSLMAQVRQRSAVGAIDLEWGVSARLDPANRARSQLDVTDLVVRASAGAIDLTLGIRQVFWGVLERRNLVDVVNQRDPGLRWPRQQKLGQPTVALMWSPPWGSVEVAVLPWARSRPCDGRLGRLWSPQPVDRVELRRDGVLPHLGWAVRWAFVAGGWNLGASFFDGSTRDPGFEDAVDGRTVIPVYDRVLQFGAEAQYTGATWLWKFEVVSLDPGDTRYVALGSGVEYAPVDYVSVFAEGFVDSRGREATTSLEHDVFLGTRLLHQDGSVTGGAVVDVVTGNVIGSIEIVRRMAQDVVVGLDVRGFVGRATDEPRFAPREETAVALFARRYF